jgi:hypothetical protein
MPDVVTVSSVEKIDELKKNIESLFHAGKYDEITQSIGMHSILIEPEHTKKDQRQLYRIVLELLKNKVRRENPKTCSSWLSAFPQLMAGIAEKKQILTDMAAADTLASHHGSFGPFSSVDAFFWWALDDRRLPLDQIVLYINTTVKMHK